MAIKKSMKEWGVSNEIEMLREIIQSSPLLREKVSQKLKALKETASQNMFQEAAQSVEQKALEKKRAQGEAD
jgi:hypothetical protein